MNISQYQTNIEKKGKVCEVSNKINMILPLQLFGESLPLRMDASHQMMGFQSFSFCIALIC